MTSPLNNTGIELSVGAELSILRPAFQNKSYLDMEIFTRSAFQGAEDQTVENANEIQYPRFSALMAAHDSFQALRRFSNLRTRLLLLSQDRAAQLEKKLDKIDRDESSVKQSQR
ncbi:hypothetical protein V8E54_011323 [Elaphomyces granulatus]